MPTPIAESSYPQGILKVGILFRDFPILEQLGPQGARVTSILLSSWRLIGTWQIWKSLGFERLHIRLLEILILILNLVFYCIFLIICYYHQCISCSCGFSVLLWVILIEMVYKFINKNIKKIKYRVTINNNIIISSGKTTRAIVPLTFCHSQNVQQISVFNELWALSLSS